MDPGDGVIVHGPGVSIGAPASSSSGSTTTATSSGSGVTGPSAPIHFIGRFDTHAPNGPRFAWPGTAIATRFSGTSLRIKLADEGTNYFAVIVDGGAPVALATSGAQDTYTIAEQLPAGEHDVWIEKRTESNQGAVTFLGFETDAGASLVPTPAPFTRHIEIVGDSITCGYGDLGQGPNCSFTPDTEDEYVAYGALAARALSASHTTISFSGVGVYRNLLGDTTDQMPILHERTIALEAASTWDFSIVPDVVVVNLGTNDFAPGDPGQAYVDAYTAFAAKLRARYPGAYLLFAQGTMLSDGYPPGAMSRTKAQQYTQAVVNARHAAGDARVGFVDLGEQDGNAQGYGCDWHPSAATHQLMAEKLVTAIRAVTSW
jgi:lysophospholipase L1-like esterase